MDRAERARSHLFQLWSLAVDFNCRPGTRAPSKVPTSEVGRSLSREQ